MLLKSLLTLLATVFMVVPAMAASADLAPAEFPATTGEAGNTVSNTTSNDASTHYAYIEQSGQNKIASIVQSGLGNWASIVQTGPNADQAYIVQSGANNRASIVQH